MAALAPQQRDMMIAMGILSGTVIDARKWFERESLTIGPLLAHTIDYDWPTPA